MKYRSVITFGRAEWIEAPEARRRALDLIMAHYTSGAFDYPETALARIVIIQVQATGMTGKKAG